MEKTYEPQIWEDAIYEKWEKSGFFNPDNLNLPENSPNYTIVFPPPNITDKLHLGHASTVAIEDLFIRYHRLKGFRTLWIPGTDHASIATQNVVEKKLLAEENLTRHDLGKEKFLERVWEFLNKTQSTILNQTRKMGASIDWSRKAFTLDEVRQKAVSKMFIDMYQEGIVYRGERVVNWCPRCKSTLADDELEYQEQKAILYTFKYSPDLDITISTTRPETKLGDTAVAVNPRDARYKDLVGQEFKINFCQQALTLKIIADNNVEMEFGTGALGVTPAHSMIDWQIGQKNNLPSIKVIDEDGKIKAGFGVFSGMSTIAARSAIVEQLKKDNLMISEEEISNNLSECYRCKSAIEPLPSKQWFINVDKKLERLGNKSLKERAIEAATNKEIEFIPNRFEKRYVDWMTNLHDWCISRQIWFGHQIPVWYKQSEVYVGTEKPEGEGWRQDPDTLDTWFSSGMWTFSTLGWPEQTADLKKYHPTQVLETGYDIITLWVSRMVMMSFFALNEIPFEKVYLHGMILDKDGQKMSKSKGNGIDPLDMKDKFGADALRLSLLIGNTPGNDTKMSEDKIASSRNFINKFWNISRFILSQCQDLSDDYEKENLSLSDQWILNHLQELISNSTENLDSYKFSLAGEELKEFTWNYLADWYLEAKKFEKDDNSPKILAFILKNLLKLWHPFIPFISEVIWQEMNQGQLLMVSDWPQAEKKKYDTSFSAIKEIISAIRQARFINKIEPSQKLQALIFDPQKIISGQEDLIKKMKTGIEEIKYFEKKEDINTNQSILITVSGVEIYLLGAIDPEKEKIRIKKERENLEKMISLLESKLSNKDFIKKAPTELVSKEQERLKEFKESLKKII